jgi:hypothetical protein
MKILASVLPIMNILESVSVYYEHFSIRIAYYESFSIRLR